MTEHDDFDDPKMSELLESWGRQVRGPVGDAANQDETAEAREARRIFEPPSDLSPLHRMLDAVDQEVARERKNPIFTLARARWFQGTMALAASLLFVVGGWWLVQDRSPSVGDGGPSAVVMLSDVQLSLAPRLERGGSLTRFHSGDKIYTHFVASGAGTAFVAMLDSELEFAPVAAAKPFPVDAGLNSPFFLVLDENAGKESVVILFSAEALDAETFETLVEWASSAGAEATSHESKLEAIVRALRSDGRVTAETVTFDHLPKPK